MVRVANESTIRTIHEGDVATQKNRGPKREESKQTEGREKKLGKKQEGDIENTEKRKRKAAFKRLCIAKLSSRLTELKNHEQEGMRMRALSLSPHPPPEHSSPTALPETKSKNRDRAGSDGHCPPSTASPRLTSRLVENVLDDPLLGGAAEAGGVVERHWKGKETKVREGEK